MATSTTRVNRVAEQGIHRVFTHHSVMITRIALVCLVTLQGVEKGMGTGRRIGMQVCAIVCV
jgi:hypothetical protein